MAEGLGTLLLGNRLRPEWIGIDHTDQGNSGQPTIQPGIVLPQIAYTDHADT